MAAANGGKLPCLGVVLAGIDGVRFRKPIRPGDQMEMLIKATQCRGPIWSFEGEVLVEGKKCAEGSFMAHLSARGQ
jgi:3-hydroxyacyl-[acyl-carrier-protein] dehydratase